MDVFQYIIICVIISILPPVTWVYSLIGWMLGGCQIQLFVFEDVAIYECGDDGMDFEDFAVLQQMLDNFMVEVKYD